jgi:hypothetical protein
MEKHQNKRNHIVNVQEKVKEIVIEDVLINRNARIYIFNQYLIIQDNLEYNDKFIRIFDKNNFKYITGIGNRGPGPYEIATPGLIEGNEDERVLYVADYGQFKILRYELDSVLANPDYVSKEYRKINPAIIPRHYITINDTLSIGHFFRPTEGSDYSIVAGKYNMLTGEITLLNAHEHPQIGIKRSGFTASLEYGIYIECYWHNDLMAIYDLDGGIKYYVYGRKWDTDSKKGRILFYGDVKICKDKIVALYADGGDNYIYNQTGAIVDGNFQTQFIIFDINGDYIQTLETGHQISRFCYDKDNNRIIMAFQNDEIQFAYLELDGII